MKFDDLITNYVGEFGIYQKTQLLLVCLPTLITSMNALSWTFAGADVNYRCRMDYTTDNDYWKIPDSFAAAIPRQSNCKEEDPSKCPFEQCTFGPGGGRCVDTGNGYVFDRSVVKYSAIERWEFVCNWTIYKAIVQAAYYIGQMAGSLIFGFLGDRIGRKKVFFIAIVLQIVGGAGMAVSPHWALYSLFRICVGFAHPGIFVIAVIIGMELVGPSKRKVASVFTGIFFALGQVLLGTLAYFVRNYQLLHIAITIPAVAFLSYWWIVPESARWLVSQKRYDEADKVLRRAARANKKQMPDKWWEDLDEIMGNEENDGEGKRMAQRSYNYFDLLRTPKLRCISLAAFFCWPVVSMLYYGMSMKTDFLGGDLYTTFVFGGLVEVPALLVMCSLVDRIGRKPIIAAGFIIAALCMISNMLLGDNVNTAVAITQFLIGKASITATYATLYTITPELFPTVIRNMATGVCSMMARVGSICASFAMMWLVDEYGKNVIVLPFASLAICAAFVSLMFLHETAGKKFNETIEEVEGWTGNRKQQEMQPLSSATAADSKTE